MEDTIFSYALIILLATSGINLGPSQINQQEVKVDTISICYPDVRDEFKEIKDKIIECINEAEESKKNIDKNKPYLDKLNRELSKRTKEKNGR